MKAVFLYADSMMHLLKGSIGAGILAMPEAIARLGIIWGPVTLAILAVFAVYCLHMLIYVQYLLCKRYKRGYMSYQKSMRLSLQEGPKCCHCLGYPLAYFTDCVLIIWQLGLCCVYLVFVAANVKQILDYYGHVIDIRIHLCYLLPPMIVVNMVKNLKLITPISTISNTATLFGLIVVFFYLVEKDLVLSDDKFQFRGIGEIPLFIGTALFAMEAVGVMLAIEYNMDNPKDFIGCCGLLNLGMAIIVALYIIVGTAGYLTYGSEIKASITLNLPENQKKAQAAKLLFSFAIFLSFPLQNYVAYEITWRKLKKRLESPEQKARRAKAGRQQEAEYDAKTTTADYALRVALVIVPWLWAVAVPQLGPFISFFGAFCLSLLAIVFPAILDWSFWYGDPRGFGPMNYKVIRDIIIGIIGMFCLIAGCYSSILEIIHDFK